MTVAETIQIFVGSMPEQLRKVSFRIRAMPRGCLEPTICQEWHDDGACLELFVSDSEVLVYVQGWSFLFLGKNLWVSTSPSYHW